MNFSAKQIASLLEGTIEGNPEATVNSLSKIEEAGPQSLSFLANPKYQTYIYTTDASVVIVNKNFELEKPLKSGCTLIRVEDAYLGFSKLLEMYNQSIDDMQGIEQPVFINPSATYGNNCYIGAFSYLGNKVSLGNNVKIYPNSYIGSNVSIGNNTIIYAGVKIYNNCQIGANCTIHSGAVIGSDGFGFAPGNHNDYKKIPQIGNVLIEDYVEIGANTTIDRATLGSTIIRKGAKLDNLIQVAHNVEIGENTVIAAQVGIAGSAKLGKNCMIGGQVGINGHIKLSDEVKVAGQAGVVSDIDKIGEIVQGTPAFTIGEFRRSYVMFKKLPELTLRLQNVENKIADK